MLAIAGLGRLARHIRLEGSAYLSIGHIVTYLAGYGRDERGQEVLGLFLNAVKPVAGPERQRVLSELMTRHAMMTPVADLPPVGDWRGGAAPAPPPEKIIVANTLRPIAFLAHALEVARPVALVTVDGGGRTMLGTGFLVAPDLMVTCAHVVPSPEALAGTTVCFNHEDDRFGNALERSEYTPAPGGLFHADRRLDFAIFELRGSPGERWGWLAWEEPRIAAGERVNIIQHPGGRPKQIAMQSNFVEYVGGDVVQYVTATLPGSSGSPVFNDSWQVCAVHRAGGDLVDPATGEFTYRNEGVLMSSVLRALPSPARDRLNAAPTLT